MHPAAGSICHLSFVIRAAVHDVLQSVVLDVIYRMNSSTLTIRLPKELRETLRRLTKALKKNESEYIRDLLARDLANRTLQERAGHLAGTLDSGQMRHSPTDHFRETIREHNWRPVRTPEGHKPERQ